jgi:hypothetical protein
MPGRLPVWRLCTLPIAKRARRNLCDVGLTVGAIVGAGPPLERSETGLGAIWGWGRYRGSKRASGIANGLWEPGWSACPACGI